VKLRNRTVTRATIALALTTATVVAAASPAHAVAPTGHVKRWSGNMVVNLSLDNGGSCIPQGDPYDKSVLVGLGELVTGADRVWVCTAGYGETFTIHYWMESYLDTARWANAVHHFTITRDNPMGHTDCPGEPFGGRSHWYGSVPQTFPRDHFGNWTWSRAGSYECGKGQPWITLRATLVESWDARV
jgi:hypothetical protein